MVISCRNATSKNCQQMVQRPVVLSSRRTEEGGIFELVYPDSWCEELRFHFLEMKS